MTRIALIHALAQSVPPINEAFQRLWPEAGCMNLLDDSLSADLASSGRGLDATMFQRFVDLTAYAVHTGAQGVLFTCSAFGPCIDAVKLRWPTLPILKPNEAMILEIEASGLAPLGLLASFAPTLASMPAEFNARIRDDNRLVTRHCAGALEALRDDQPEQHDTIIVEHGLALKAAGIKALAVAQFSMARVAPRLREATGLPVFTTPDSAVRALHARVAAL